MNRESSGKLKKILAWGGLFFFAGIFLSLILQLVRGAAPGVILAHLFCLIVVPCIFYIFRWLKQLHDNK